MSFYSQLLEEYEIGWRAAGAIAREAEGPTWMRRHIISMRWNAPNSLAESEIDLRERSPKQMM